MIPLDWWRLLGLSCCRGRRRALAVPSVSAFVRPAARALVLDPNDRVLPVSLRQSGHRPAFLDDAGWRDQTGGVARGRDPPRAPRGDGARGRARAADLDTTRGVCLDRQDDRPARAVHPCSRHPSSSRGPTSGSRGSRRKTSTSFAGGRSRSSRPRMRVFYPTRLAHFLRQLLEQGPPDEPIDVGVWNPLERDVVRLHRHAVELTPCRGPQTRSPRSRRPSAARRRPSRRRERRARAPRSARRRRAACRAWSGSGSR